MQTDAPSGFWDQLNITEENRHHFFPVHEVILGNDLRLPLEKRKQQAVSDLVYLEDIADEFFSFVSQTGSTIIHDSVSKIPINKPLS